ncbi:hypothetical protein EYF80_049711 [Liparis tanakae]|uniref:Uncharacterized protein n=1 Tax=Liparis tanakae TaxID=230148 RepID=A0A4Z2FG07_9TELE|nr:hypothetical protein EYF80_049711 [Liparis tanakae]
MHLDSVSLRAEPSLRPPGHRTPAREVKSSRESRVLSPVSLTLLWLQPMPPPPGPRSSAVG